MTESPPLFDTETKLDDLEDDDEDIFASAVQVSPMASSRPRRESRFYERRERKKKIVIPTSSQYRDATRNDPPSWSCDKRRVFCMSPEVDLFENCITVSIRPIDVLSVAKDNSVSRLVIGTR